MTEKATRHVTVMNAAKEIGCAPEYLRRQMKAGVWDLGRIVKPGRESRNFRYFIFRNKLDRFCGVLDEGSAVYIDRFTVP